MSRVVRDLYWDGSSEEDDNGGGPDAEGRRPEELEERVSSSQIRILEEALRCIRFDSDSESKMEGFATLVECIHTNAFYLDDRHAQELFASVTHALRDGDESVAQSALSFLLVFIPIEHNRSYAKSQIITILPDIVSLFGHTKRKGPAVEIIHLCAQCMKMNAAIVDAIVTHGLTSDTNQVRLQCVTLILHVVTDENEKDGIDFSSLINTLTDRLVDDHIGVVKASERALGHLRQKMKSFHIYIRNMSYERQSLIREHAIAIKRFADQIPSRGVESRRKRSGQARQGRRRPRDVDRRDEVKSTPAKTRPNPDEKKKHEDVRSNAPARSDKGRRERRGGGRRRRLPSASNASAPISSDRSVDDNRSDRDPTTSTRTLRNESERYTEERSQPKTPDTSLTLTNRERSSTLAFGFIPSSTLKSLSDASNRDAHANAVNELSNIVDDLSPSKIEFLRNDDESRSSLFVFLSNLLLEYEPSVAKTVLLITSKLLTMLGRSLQISSLEIITPSLKRKLGDLQQPVRDEAHRAWTALSRCVNTRSLLSLLDDSDTLRDSNELIREGGLKILIHMILTNRDSATRNMRTIVRLLAESLQDVSADVKYAALESCAVLNSASVSTNVIEMLADEGISEEDDDDDVISLLRRRFLVSDLPYVDTKGCVVYVNKREDMIASTTSRARHRRGTRQEQTPVPNKSREDMEYSIDFEDDSISTPSTSANMTKMLQQSPIVSWKHARESATNSKDSAQKNLRRLFFDESSEADASSKITPKMTLDSSPNKIRKQQGGRRQIDDSTSSPEDSTSGSSGDGPSSPSSSSSSSPSSSETRDSRQRGFGSLNDHQSSVSTKLDSSRDQSKPLKDTESTFLRPDPTQRLSTSTESNTRILTPPHSGRLMFARAVSADKLKTEDNEATKVSSTRRDDIRKTVQQTSSPKRFETRRNRLTLLKSRGRRRKGGRRPSSIDSVNRMSQSMDELPRDALSLDRPANSRDRSRSSDMEMDRAETAPAEVDSSSTSFARTMRARPRNRTTRNVSLVGSAKLGEGIFTPTNEGKTHGDEKDGMMDLSAMNSQISRDRDRRRRKEDTDARSGSLRIGVSRDDRGDSGGTSRTHESEDDRPLRPMGSQSYEQALLAAMSNGGRADTAPSEHGRRERNVSRATQMARKRRAERRAQMTMSKTIGHTGPSTSSPTNASLGDGIFTPKATTTRQYFKESPTGTEGSARSFHESGEGGPAVFERTKKQYTESSELKPCDQPSRALKASLKVLGAEGRTDWATQFEALNNVRRLAIHHASVLKPHLHTTSLRIVECVQSLRSQVAKNGLMCVRDMFEYLGSMMDNEIETLAVHILKRATDTNSFVKQQADAALSNMVCRCSTSRVLSQLLSHRSHKSSAIRAKAAHGLRILAEHVSFDRSDDNERNLEKLVRAAGSCLTDSAAQCRAAGREIVWSLQRCGFFEGDCGAERMELVGSAAMSRLRDALRQGRQSYARQRRCRGSSAEDRKTASSNSSREGSRGGRPPRSGVSSSSSKSRRRGGRRRDRSGSRESDVDTKRDRRMSDELDNTLQSIFFDMGGSDWRKRKLAVERLTMLVEKAHTNSIADRMFAIFDQFNQRMLDGNMNVSVMAIESVARVIPMFKGHQLTSVVPMLVHTLTQQLGSTKSKVKDLSLRAFDTLIDNVPSQQICSDLANAAKHSLNNHARIVILERLCDLLPSVYKSKPRHVSNVVLPVAFKFLAEMRGPMEAVNTRLLVQIHRLIGEKLIDRAEDALNGSLRKKLTEILKRSRRAR